MLATIRRRDTLVPIEDREVRRGDLRHVPERLAAPRHEARDAALPALREASKDAAVAGEDRRLAFDLVAEASRELRRAVRAIREEEDVPGVLLALRLRRRRIGERFLLADELLDARTRFRRELHPVESGRRDLGEGSFADAGRPLLLPGGVIERDAPGAPNRRVIDVVARNREERRETSPLRERLDGAVVLLALLLVAHRPRLERVVLSLVVEELLPARVVREVGVVKRLQTLSFPRRLRRLVRRFPQALGPGGERDLLFLGLATDPGARRTERKERLLAMVEGLHLLLPTGEEDARFVGRRRAFHRRDVVVHVRAEALFELRDLRLGRSPDLLALGVLEPGERRPREARRERFLRMRRRRRDRRPREARRECFLRMRRRRRGGDLRHIRSVPRALLAGIEKHAVIRKDAVEHDAGGEDDLEVARRPERLFGPVVELVVGAHVREPERDGGVRADAGEVEIREHVLLRPASVRSKERDARAPLDDLAEAGADDDDGARVARGLLLEAPPEPEVERPGERPHVGLGDLRAARLDDDGVEAPVRDRPEERGDAARRAADERDDGRRPPDHGFWGGPGSHGANLPRSKLIALFSAA